MEKVKKAGASGKGGNGLVGGVHDEMTEEMAVKLLKKLSVSSSDAEGVMGLWLGLDDYERRVVRLRLSGYTLPQIVGRVGGGGRGYVINLLRRPDVVALTQRLSVHAFALAAEDARLFASEVVDVARRIILGEEDCTPGRASVLGKYMALVLGGMGGKGSEGVVEGVGVSEEEKKSAEIAGQYPDPVDEEEEIPDLDGHVGGGGEA